MVTKMRPGETPGRIADTDATEKLETLRAFFRFVHGQGAAAGFFAV